MKICNVFWFRRDLRLYDNVGLSFALKESLPVLPVFIFDKKILAQFPEKKDTRVTYIYNQICRLKKELQKVNSDLLVLHDEVDRGWEFLSKKFNVKSVFFNNDYEPSAIERDQQVKSYLESKNISVFNFKDQVLFEKNELLTAAKKTFTVFTPYQKAWKAKLQSEHYQEFICSSENFIKVVDKFSMPAIEQMGYEKNALGDKEGPVISIPQKYESTRDNPSLSTSMMGLSLRFGVVSIRELVRLAIKKKENVFLSELIWRDFFAQILFNYPHSENKCFKLKYENIKWQFDEENFKLWKEGKTGYPLVDAGMRQLNQTGFMHNRVRMVVASFLTKHLAMHWKHGEKYFAQKLLDYDLASNVGNWQWAASTGCDAVPYFRVFNPELQQQKFDPDFKYIKKWVPEYGTSEYPKPIVEHKTARVRAINIFKQLNKKPTVTTC